MKYNSIICLTKRFYRQGSYMEIALQQKKNNNACINVRTDIRNKHSSGAYEE